MVKCKVDLCTFSCFMTFLCNIVITATVEKECPEMDRDCALNYYRDLKLARRLPVKSFSRYIRQAILQRYRVGHITKLSLENGQIREMKTLSMKPPLFEIPNYLSPEECDDIIKIAEEQGLEKSETMDEDMFEDVKNFEENHDDIFRYYDYNKDDFLDVDEILILLDTEMDFSPDREDVIDMFQKINFDKDDDLKISMEEFQKKDIKGLIRFVARTKRSKPYTKSRNSNQTWLETDRNSVKTLQSLRQRLQKVTQLPLALLNASESLQVVSYGPRGHYNCHLDSDDINNETKCCHIDEYESQDCRICRYLTLLYFLNDVEEGGETAFPIADNETYDEDVWHKDAERACNVGRYCHKSNIRVKPEKGKAILWYSHIIDDDTGWLGDADPYSVHGGCDVKKGRKWIANNWISVSENRTDDIDFWIKNFHTSDQGGKKRLEPKSGRKDKTAVFDDVFHADESENTRKEEDINSIFDSLELSDMEDIRNREDL